MKKYLLLGVVGLIALASPHAAFASSSDNLAGWAWSSTIGWVSLNCTNTGACGTSNYGVNVAANGALSGYAWSPNVGWISFNSADVSGCPSGTCAPTFTKATGQLDGWARVISGTGSVPTDTGGYAGWIHLKGSNYGVTVNGCSWSGYGWGGDADINSGVVGWLSFAGNGSGGSAVYGVTGTGNGCATPPIVASCSVSPTTTTLGNPVTWTATASGGVGGFTYAWNGTGGLTGATGASVPKTYGSAGTYMASTTVTSGGVSTTVNCTNTAVIGPARPDLTADATTPVTANSGTPVTFSSVIRNTGSAAAGKTFQSKFERSDTNVGNGTNIVFLGAFIDTNLGIGASETATSQPYTFSSSGTWYVRACADFSDQVLEATEANNCSAWTAVTVTTPQADLIAMAATPQSTAVNQATTLSVTAKNIGNATSASGWPTVMQVCDDGACVAINTNASLAGTVGTALAQNATQTISATYTPTTATQLMYRMCVNETSSWTNVATESDYSNNCGQWATLTVTAPDLSAGTITPTTATMTAPVTLSSTISNGGTAATGGSFTTLFQRATDNQGTGVTDIGTFTTPNIPTSGSTAATLSYTFPVGGTVYVRACADKSSAVNNGIIIETNEANNCGAWTAVSVNAPDITVTQPITPSAATTTIATTYTTTIKNTGTLTTGSTFNNLFQFDGDADHISGITATQVVTAGPIATNGTANVSATYAFASGGTGYVRFCADSDASLIGTITESNEGNNCSSWTSITVTTPTPDLTVAVSASPITTPVSQAVSLPITVSNIGNGPTSAVAKTYYFVDLNGSHTSQVSTWGSQLPVGGIDTPNPMANGAVQNTSGTYTFSSAGTYFYRACTDWTDTLAELDENNNCSGWQTITVGTPVNPDLYVTAGVTPTTATAGIGMQLNGSLSNSNVADTNFGFSNLFEIDNDNVHNLFTDIYANATNVRSFSLAKNATTVALANYTFPTAGMWYVRLCANTNSSNANSSNFTESNYANNCGPWTTITVSNPPAPTATLTPATQTSTTPGASKTLNYACSSTATANLSTPSFSVNLTPAVAGSYTVNPTNTTIYTLTCTGPSGATGTATATINVTGTVVTGPDLVAGPIPSGSINAGNNLVLSSLVTNGGNATTGGASYTLFQQANDANGTGATNLGTTFTSTIGAGGSQTINYTQQFNSVGTYYVRACADNNTSWGGTITETDETNNCGAWSAITVNAAPTGNLPDLYTNGVTGSGTAGTPTTIQGWIYNSSPTVAINSSFSNIFQVQSGAIFNGATVNSLAASGNIQISGSYTFTTPGTYNVRICADNNASWQTSITESDENNNCSAWYPITITGSAGTANLTAGAVTPTSATAGSATTFSATINNTGSSSTGAGFTTLFQSASDVNGTGATSIGTFANATLANGASAPATLSYTFANGGTYFVRACADNNASFVGTISESSENDNCGPWTGITVAGAGVQPDLTAGAPNAASGTTGSPVSFTGTVTNVGNGAAGAFNNIFQIQNGALVAATNIPALAAGAGPTNVTGSYTFSAAGTYNVRTCVDADTSWVGTVSESNENNNCSGWTSVTITAATGADLTISSITPTTAAASISPRTFSATITNSGTVTSGTGGTTKFSWSPNADGSSATVMNTLSNTPTALVAGQTQVVSGTKAFSSVGTYYIQACTDTANVVTESNDNNNCSPWTAITITPGTASPNLIIANITASTTANGNTSFTGTVSNIGSVSTGAAFSTQFYMASSSSGTNASNLGTPQSGSALAANSNRQVSVGGATGFAFTPGTIYVRAFVDSGSVINEGTDEGDNYSAWTPITITGATAPNLTAGTVTTNPASPAAGSASTVISSTVTNSGNSSTGSGFNTLFQVANDSSGTGAVSAGTYALTSALPATGGNTAVASVTYNFPFAGVFYVRACVDNNSSFVGTIAESDENDNCGAWNAVTVVGGTAANLVAGSTTVNPTSPSSGSATTLTATITNSGNTTASNFPNMFQIENGPLVAVTSPATLTLTSGNNQAVSASYTFPAVGTYRVRACADNNTSWTGVVTESNEGDNCGPWKTVTVSGASVNCTVDKTTALLNSTVTYTAVPTTGVTAPYAWTASDGASGLGTAITTSRTFTTAGTYSMQVTGTGSSAPGFCPNVQAGAGACGVLTSATITATPARISSGGTAQISWNATGVSGSCTISGPGITTTISAADASCNTSSATEPLTTPALTSQATYTIDCGGVKSTAVVNVVPAIKEI